MKIIRVGDPHAKVGNLDEMKALILFVVEQAKLHNVDRVEILGDLFHTHNVVRLEVIEFWNWALDILPKTCETVVIVGNHDVSGDYSSNFSALSLFGLINRKNLHIIDIPKNLGVFGYVPYTHSAETFIHSARNLETSGVRVLVCHQTFEGSKYESGIYAPDGIQTGEWSEKFIHIISGHIHSEQSFGNIIYPGTARWDSNTDANRRKGIWLYDHEAATGRINSVGFISTGKVCSPIQCIEWREGECEPASWGSNERISIELIGSSVWVASQKERLKGKCSIKTKITDKKSSVVRKTGSNFEDFMKNLFVSTMNRESLIKYAKEIGIV